MKVKGKEEVLIRAHVKPWLENRGGKKTPLTIVLYSTKATLTQALRAGPSPLWEKCLLLPFICPWLMPHQLSNSPPSFIWDLPIKYFLCSYLPVLVYASKFSPFWPMSSSKKSGIYFCPKPALSSNPRFLWCYPKFILPSASFTHAH